MVAKLPFNTYASSGEYIFFLLDNIRDNGRVEGNE